jgi:hypothetical protein
LWIDSRTPLESESYAQGAVESESESESESEARCAAVVHSGCWEAPTSAAPAVAACLPAAASMMNLACAPLFACSDLADHPLASMTHLVRVPASACFEPADAAYCDRSAALAVLAQTRTAVAYFDPDGRPVAAVVALVAS